MTIINQLEKQPQKCKCSMCILLRAAKEEIILLRGLLDLLSTSIIKAEEANDAKV